jgi:plastocyanin
MLRGANTMKTKLIPAGILMLATMGAWAGGDNVKYPADYLKWTLYQTLDRYDNKQYRELYTQQSTIDAVKAGKPIPSGTVLMLVQWSTHQDAKGVPLKGPDGRFIKKDILAHTVMEKRAGWGKEYPDAWRNGEWEYQLFNAKGEVNAKANLKACFECHKPHEKQDYVISLAKLAGTFPSGHAKAKPGPSSISIAEFLFGPQKLEIKAGGTATWTNVDDSPHWIAVSGSDQRTPVMVKGQSASLKFDKPGTYGYICGLHPAMKGTVEVK